MPKKQKDFSEKIPLKSNKVPAYTGAKMRYDIVVILNLERVSDNVKTG